MQLRRLHKTAFTYAKRSIYWKQNSFPFISGDLFADESDVSMYPPKFRTRQPSRSEVSDARVIFCPSDHLERLLSEFKGAINAKVLILGNSDRDFADFDFALPNSLKKVYIQNLNFKDSRLAVLPIGIENRRLGNNGQLNLFSEKYANNEKNNKLLVGPFSMTHSERLFYNSLDDSDQWKILKGRISPRALAQESSKYRFVASPRGNGLDTHRFWETLYRGSLPVVVESQWSRDLALLGIPLVSIDSWQPASLSKIFEGGNQYSFSPKKIDALWWGFWKRSIDELL